jgi:hypothetical protein
MRMLEITRSLPQTVGGTIVMGMVALQRELDSNDAEWGEWPNGRWLELLSLVTWSGDSFKSMSELSCFCKVKCSERQLEIY